MLNMTKKTLAIITVFVLISVSASGTSFITVPKGMIHRAYVTYKDSDEITVKSGYGECNGDFWQIDSDTDVSLAGVLPSGEDMVYIYIDDSASSYPTPTIIADVNEPSWNDFAQGWYYGYDRCIGVVWSPGTGATIAEFYANSDNESMYDAFVKSVAENMNPSGAWQDTTYDASDYLPVNATHVWVAASNYDYDAPSNDNIVMNVKAKDLPGSGIGDTSYEVGARAQGWIVLGPSRDLQILGQDDDDNTFNVHLYGWKIER